MLKPADLSPATLFEQPPFAPDHAQKASALLAGLAELTEHHRTGSDAYRRMVDTVFATGDPPRSLAEVPWLPARLFKRMDLASVPRDRIVKLLVSSGTTAQAVSRIHLDAETAALQTRALARIAADFLGKQRMPMVIVDNRSFLDDRTRFNARAAGIIGFSTFGRDHFYALDAALEPDWNGLETHLAKHGSAPVLAFGFTFVVWQQLVERARTQGRRLHFPPGSILVHGGGWKRLADRNIGNDAFKAAVAEVLGIERVHNYYGMVEQVGSVFFECEAGFLHPPSFADVLVRDAVTLEPLPRGETGLVQVLSLLPRSYPGHSLLTEDLGTIHGEDDCRCGRNGKRFTIEGRLANVEIRGCSDTRTVPSP